MKLGKTKKIVQGSYISIETKRILVREAKKTKNIYYYFSLPNPRKRSTED